MHSADPVGAATGCLVLIPLLDWLERRASSWTAAALGFGAAVCFAPSASRVHRRGRYRAAFCSQLRRRQALHHSTWYTKGHEGDRILFDKWNSFSRVAVYDRQHGDWSLSPSFKGIPGDSLFMDIDSAASTPILKGTGNPTDATYLRYELTALAYHLVERPAGFTALVIGPWEDATFSRHWYSGRSTWTPLKSIPSSRAM